MHMFQDSHFLDSKWLFMFISQIFYEKQLVRRFWYAKIRKKANLINTNSMIYAEAFYEKVQESVCSRTRTCLLEPSQILSAMDLFVEKPLNYFFQKVYVVDVQLDSKYTPKNIFGYYHVTFLKFWKKSFYRNLLNK